MDRVQEMKITDVTEITRDNTEIQTEVPGQNHCQPQNVHMGRIGTHEGNWEGIGKSGRVRTRVLWIARHFACYWRPGGWRFPWSVGSRGQMVESGNTHCSFKKLECEWEWWLEEYSQSKKELLFKVAIALVCLISEGLVKRKKLMIQKRKSKTVEKASEEMRRMLVHWVSTFL